jgi:Glycosyl hydrolase family 63 C-terminal domain
MTAEKLRLEQDRNHTAHWRRWGCYLSERQWGTVREDYSEDGLAWQSFPHDHARSRAYRWGEDGIAGISDNHQHLCFAIALWNEADPILKERIFGLSSSEGNHGEDVKEYYFYLDNTPTHSYMQYLYKYPQQTFPYERLVEENHRRDKKAAEFELLDTGIFENDSYFDVLIEYAKVSPEDILIQVSITNRGSEAKPIHVLPTLWFRNTWSWFKEAEKPWLKAETADPNQSIIKASHFEFGNYWLYCESDAPGVRQPELLFTENETNFERLYGTKNASPYVKDGINDHVVKAVKTAVNPDCIGTKAAAHYVENIAPGETKTIRLRLSNSSGLDTPFGNEFDATFQARRKEANNFYQNIIPPSVSEDERNVQRQAFAGMLWNKQFYHYVVEDWLKGDPASAPPAPNHKNSRNADWTHLYNDDVLSMPDKWEYPWYAAWDLAFHVIPIALIDPDFAKRQLLTLTRECYMHPNGQLPAYEWSLSDVNPPVHAWASWQIYKIEQAQCGRSDTDFLERIFQKLLINFTWWVNRKDINGQNIFQGGFLGLDNIGVFDRNSPLPTAGHLEQADATAWMAMYCMNMLTIALELATHNPVYEDICSKFFEHFLRISDAVNGGSHKDQALWDKADGFFYDALRFEDGHSAPLKVRSVVGLIPLFTVGILEAQTLKKLPNFKRRSEWFAKNRPNLTAGIAQMQDPGMNDRKLLAMIDADKLRQILHKLLDESEFLSPYGIRALSKFHAEHPYIFEVNGDEYRVDYEPAESSTDLMGGNSNWRGPIWFPINYLIIESLREFHQYFGDSFKVECPTGSGNEMTLAEVAINLSERLVHIFLKDSGDRRPVYGSAERFQKNPHWRDKILFYEYFHGDSGAGLGASHQTGWTGLVARLIHQCHTSQF